MDNRKAKQAATKSNIKRSVSDSVDRVTSPKSTVKPKLSSDHQPSTPANKGPVSVAQKHGKASKDLEKSRQKTNFPNSPFSVLVRVAVAAKKWRKIVKEAAEKRSSSRIQSLPPPALRPV